MALPQATVLISALGSSTSQSIAKAFREQQEIAVRIVGIDALPGHLSAAPEYCDVLRTVPLVSQEVDYRAAIEEIVAAEGVQAIFPVADPELPFYAKQVEVFRQLGAETWISSRETVDLCLSKLRCSEFLRQRGLPFLPTARYRADAPLPFAFPMILKPEQGVSSRNVFRVDDEDELRVLSRRVHQPVLQPYIEGDEYTIDVLGNRDSEPISAVPRKRIETKAGLCTKGITVADDDLLACAAEIVPALRLVGPANLQCRRDAGGTLHFFEVNPRFGSASPITKAAGVNQPLVLLKLTLGLESPARRYPFRPGVLMLRHWREVFRSDVP